MRIQELPHDLTLGRHLERASLVRLRDQRVAIRESLTRALAQRVEVLGLGCAVLPHDLVGEGIEFDHAGPFAGHAVVEDEDVAVGEDLGVVGAEEFAEAPGPDDAFLGPVEDGDAVLMT